VAKSYCGQLQVWLHNKIEKLKLKLKRKKKNLVMYWQWSFMNEFRYIFGGFIYFFKKKFPLLTKALYFSLSPNII
jgi:hypothetical protein